MTERSRGVRRASAQCGSSPSRCCDAAYFAQPGSHMFGQMDQPGLFTRRTTDCLANPPGCVGSKMTAALVIKLLCRTHQAKIPLLNKIYQGNSRAGIAAGNRDDKTKIRFNELAT